MQRVFKYELAVTDAQVVVLPRGAGILSIQAQFDKPCLWALVDQDGAPENRTIEIYGTGHSIAEFEGLTYIGTFQLHGGSLVFHAFERD